MMPIAQLLMPTEDTNIPEPSTVLPSLLQHAVCAQAMPTVAVPTEELSVGVSLADTPRLEALLQEAEAELAHITPQLTALEATLNQVQAQVGELKQKRQRLLGLTTSLSALLVPSSAVVVSVHNANSHRLPNGEKIQETQKPKSVKRQLPLLPPSSDGVFLPALAFKQGDTILKRKDSINYEIFRAIVYQGGQATTEQIRQYLIEQKVVIPKTGETFETVSLSEISARVSYLVKHGIARSVGTGSYLSCFGWDQPVQ
jgi:hypothetical protein